MKSSSSFLASRFSRLCALPLAAIATAALVGACAANAAGVSDTAGDDAGAGASKSDAGRSSSSRDGGSKASSSALDGKDLVTQLDCGGCHTGNRGELAGNTTPVKGTEQYPPNLTPDEATGLGNWSDEQIARAIKTGVDDEGAQLCPKMPHFKELNDDEVGAIVAYLRSLAPVKSEIPESVCPPLKNGDDGEDHADADAGPVVVTDAGSGPGPVVDSGGPTPIDAGHAVDAGPSCNDYADPNTPAGCHCDPSLHACQPNGCYGGYVCLTTTNKCRAAKPAGCP